MRWMPRILALLGTLASPGLPALAVVPTVPARPLVLNDVGSQQSPPDLGHEVVGLADGRACVFAREGFALYAMPTSNSGIEFEPEVLVAGRGRSADVIDFDAVGTEDGKMHALLLVAGPVEGRGVQLVHSDDGGRTWTLPLQVIAGNGEGPLLTLSRLEEVAFDIDDKGRAAVAFMRGGHPYVAFSGDGGSTWTEPVQLGPASVSSRIEDLTLGPSGAIHVVLIDRDAAGAFWAYMTHSVDQGATFTPLVSLAAFEASRPFDTWNAEMRETVDGRVLLLVGAAMWARSSPFRARVYVSVDGGNTFSHSLDQEWTERTEPPDLALAGLDVVVMAHAYHYNTQGRLVARRWPAGAPGFGPEEVLDLTGNAFVTEVQLAPLSDGAWVASWMHRSADAKPQFQIERSNASRTGAWSPVLGTTVSGPGHGMANVAGEAVLLAWAQDEDVYAGHAQPPGPLEGQQRVDVDGAPIPTPISSVAIGGDGEDRVVAAIRTGDRLEVRTSVDRGKTFGPAVPITDGSFVLGADVLVQATPDGWAYVFFDVSGNPLRKDDATLGIFSLWVAHSADGGATWSEASPAPLYASARALGVAPGGRISLAWALGSQVWSAHSEDGGATFVSVPIPGAIGFSITSLSRCGDEVTLAWSLSEQIKVTTSEDGGATWTAMETLGAGDEPTLTCAAGSRRVVAWKVYPSELHLRRGGPTGWSPLQVISDSISFYTTTVLLGQVQNDLLVVLNEPFDPLLAMHSADGGVTFDAPVTLDGDLARPEQFSLAASLAMDAEGHAWVVWLDDAHGWESFVAVRRSDDSGTTWGPTRRIDHDPAPGALGKSLAGECVATLSRGAVVAWSGWHHQTGFNDALLSGDDLLDQDRDGVSSAQDCDDTDPEVTTLCGSSPPLADAGQDHSVECTGELSASVLLDGSASTDPDGNQDLGSFLWTEDGTVLATTTTAELSFALGVHRVTLAVTDLAGQSDTDEVQVEVVDTHPPQGGVSFPTGGACFGASALPIQPVAAFTDACDPSPVLTWTPSPGPYTTHGDHTVQVRAVDSAGLLSTDAVSFTIDLVSPQAFLNLGSHPRLPTQTPLPIYIASSDDDGATGGVLRETIDLEGCVLFDGAIEGDTDGLLSDEALSLSRADLCSAAARCGWGTLLGPRLRLRATDGGGNVGEATLRLQGALPLGRACRSGSVPLVSERPAGPRPGKFGK